MERKEEGIPVLVNMASMASYDGMTDDPIQVITTGTLFPKKEYLLLRYIENQEDETTGEVMESEIHLVMKKNQVTMNRMGQFANTMLFQPNRRYETVFRTPYGDPGRRLSFHGYADAAGHPRGPNFSLPRGGSVPVLRRHPPAEGG